MCLDSPSHPSQRVCHRCWLPWRLMFENQETREQNELPFVRREITFPSENSGQQVNSWFMLCSAWICLLINSKKYLPQRHQSLDLNFMSVLMPILGRQAIWVKVLSSPLCLPSLWAGPWTPVHSSTHLLMKCFSCHDHVVEWGPSTLANALIFIGCKQHSWVSPIVGSMMRCLFILVGRKTKVRLHWHRWRKWSRPTYPLGPTDNWQHWIRNLSHDSSFSGEQPELSQKATGLEQIQRAQWSNKKGHIQATPPSWGLQAKFWIKSFTTSSPGTRFRPCGLKAKRPILSHPAILCIVFVVVVVVIILESRPPYPFVQLHKIPHLICWGIYGRGTTWIPLSALISLLCLVANSFLPRTQRNRNRVTITGRMTKRPSCFRLVEFDPCQAEMRREIDCWKRGTFDKSAHVRTNRDI